MTRFRYESTDPRVTPDAIDALRHADPEADSVLWSKRNMIWRCDGQDGRHWAVKRFSHRFPSPLIYAVRASKARRSYTYSVELTKRGIHTPAPVCYAEWRGACGTLLDSVYVSEYEDSIPLVNALKEADDRNAVLRGLANFFARMHAAGFIHRDANLTNIRLSHGVEPDFSVIDLNRMKIYPEGTLPPLAERFDDLCNWSGLDDDFRAFAPLYVEAAGLPADAVASLLEAKRRFDRNAGRRKMPKKILRRLMGKKSV